MYDICTIYSSEAGDLNQLEQTSLNKVKNIYFFLSIHGLMSESIGWGYIWGYLDNPLTYFYCISVRYR